MLCLRSSSTATITVETSSTKDRPLNTNRSLPLCKSLKEAKQIHAKIIKSPQILEPSYSLDRLVEFYAISENGSLPYAERLLFSIESLSPFLWNIIIKASLINQDPLKAIQIYKLLNCSYARPDPFTFIFVLKACTQLQETGLGRQLHCQINKCGFQSSLFICNKLIHFYAISKCMSDARLLFDRMSETDVVSWNSMLKGYADNGDYTSLLQVFDRMPKRDVVSWNIMIAFYVRNNQFRQAVSTFRKMQDSSVPPDRVTFVSILTATAHLGALAQGKWVHSYINKYRIEIDDNISSALISMYSKCGYIEGAIKVFDDMDRKGVDVWNSMICGLAANGQCQKALEFFLTMRSLGVQPDALTFSSVLNACSHRGLVDDGVKYFLQMKEIHEIKPDIAHYGCMIDLFGRAGMFKKVEDVIREMPMEPDAVMLKTLLGACKIHGNFELGEKTGYQLIELAPSDNAGYVLLSNLYAMFGKWDGVHKIRKMMSDRGIRKIPGCSFVEIDGVIHEFIAGDTLHSKKKEIYQMLGEIVERLKLIGHEPDTKQVLQDIEEEEMKENALQYHSEKIAIAFGLISTAPGATIRVVKNLRVCNDCHSVLKHLSAIYEREIIVRDANRFHHFRNGSCSCYDFW